MVKEFGDVPCRGRPIDPIGYVRRARIICYKANVLVLYQCPIEFFQTPAYVTPDESGRSWSAYTSHQMGIMSVYNETTPADVTANISRSTISSQDPACYTITLSDGVAIGDICTVVYRSHFRSTDYDGERSKQPGDHVYPEDISEMVKALNTKPSNMYHLSEPYELKFTPVLAVSFADWSLGATTTLLEYTSAAGPVAGNWATDTLPFYITAIQLHYVRDQKELDSNDTSILVSIKLNGVETIYDEGLAIISGNPDWSDILPQISQQTCYATENSKVISATATIPVGLISAIPGQFTSFKVDVVVPADNVSLLPTEECEAVLQGWCVNEDKAWHSPP